MAVIQQSTESLLFDGLKTALEGVDGIEKVYAWNMQYLNEADNRALGYPYAAINLQTDWNPDASFTADVEQNQQTGICTVTIHIVYETLKVETDMITEIYALVDTVYRALNGLEVLNGDYGVVATALQRTTTGMDTDHDQLSDWVMVFSTQLTELSWQDPDRVTATPTDVVINSDLDIDNPIVRTGDGEA